MPDKPMTWTDIKTSLKNSEAKGPVKIDPEKLEYFKKMILCHLDSLQAEADKKAIPFPKKKPGTKTK